MKILLIGGGGFVGQSLYQKLQQKEYDVYIADKSFSSTNNHKYYVDICNEESVNQLIESIKPDRILHLAAQSFVPFSWQNPNSTFMPNIIGSINVFQAIARIVPHARMIFIGSGEEYGRNATKTIITEDSPCNPINPYAISKLAAGTTLELLAKRNSIDFVHLRPFNHYGPYQNTQFVIADFCSQIAKMEKNLQTPELFVGNLQSQKDFLYIDDVLEAYILFLEKDKLQYQCYNICSEKMYSIQTILDTIIAQTKLNITVNIDANKYRPTDIPMKASAVRTQEELHWFPKIKLEEGLKKTLDYWRTQYSK